MTQSQSICLQILLKVKPRGEKFNRDSLMADFFKLRSYVKNPWRLSPEGVFKLN